MAIKSTPHNDNRHDIGRKCIYKGNCSNMLVERYDMVIARAFSYLS